jgi:hypothetical protein
MPIDRIKPGDSVGAQLWGFGRGRATAEFSSEGRLSGEAGDTGGAMRCCDLRAGVSVKNARLLRGEGRIGATFADAGISRYFVWISPGPGIEVVRRWLADAGLTRRPYVRYLTIAHDARETVLATTGFDLREVDARQVERLSGKLDGVISPECLHSLGAPGVHHFMAFEGGRPVASAVLCTFKELAT